MTTVALTPEGEAFLARVRDELADLPPDERDELLEDIESHLAEVAGEGEVALAARLGSAEEFAQELRNSAGLPPRAAPSEPSRLQAARAWLDDAVRRVMAVRPHLTGALVWQLARGWLLAVAFALTIAALGNTAAWSYRHTWLPHAGLRGFGALIALAGFVALSFWLARRAAAGRGVQLDRAASALALVAIVPALWHLDNPAREVTCIGCTYQTVQAAPPGLYFNGTPISNIFPFDRDGKPLDDVLLYLRDGRALNVDANRIDPKRRYLAKPSGQRLYNSFPVRFYQHLGSAQIAKGWIRPSVHIPQLRIPPLDGQAS